MFGSGVHCASVLYIGAGCTLCINGVGMYRVYIWPYICGIYSRTSWCVVLRSIRAGGRGRRLWVSCSRQLGRYMQTSRKRCTLLPNTNDLPLQNERPFGGPNTSQQLEQTSLKLTPLLPACPALLPKSFSLTHSLISVIFTNWKLYSYIVLFHKVHHMELLPF